MSGGLLEMPTTRLQDRIEEWRKRLLDLSKRNRLVNCKIGARGAIEVVHPKPESVWQRIVVDNGTMSFAWRRDLLDEEDEDESPPLSLFIEEGEDDHRNKDDSAEETTGKAVTSGPKRSEMEECLAAFVFVSSTGGYTQSRLARPRR